MGQGDLIMSTIPRPYMVYFGTIKIKVIAYDSIDALVQSSISYCAETGEQEAPQITGIEPANIPRSLMKKIKKEMNNG